MRRSQAVTELINQVRSKADGTRSLEKPRILHLHDISRSLGFSSRAVASGRHGPFREVGKRVASMAKRLNFGPHHPSSITTKPPHRLCHNRVLYFCLRKVCL